MKKRKIQIVKNQYYLIIKKLFILITAVSMEESGMRLINDRVLEHIDGKMVQYILVIGKIM